MKYVSASEAAKVVKSGDRIYVHAAAATPNVLTKAISDRADELRGVEFCHIHTEGAAPYADPALADSFHVNSFFIGKNVRHTIAAGNGSYTPVFLSEVPNLFRKGAVTLDVVLIQVSPPDEHGFCSLGVSVEATVAAMEFAKVVIAQINSFMPRTFGDSVLHISKIDMAVEHNCPLYASKPTVITDTEAKIGGFVAELIEDESTLQMGIGNIPNAVLAQLTNHKDLGLHTEMFSDGVIDLIESGVINCSKKAVTKGRALATFLIGSERLYKFVDNNPFIVLKESNYVNDTSVIRQNPKVVAINSALEVDLTGQVCADSLGTKMYSGVGGQMDFVRGASLSKGGKAIIALSSVSNRGDNRIVPFLKQGAGVVTTRAHAQYIVTEYGVADLYGKTLKQRVEAMASIAHPNFREEVLRTYYNSIK
ncbi:acetyl-CoA hydrolase/transferase C-terminal domain-containing protein [Myroides phaeus]|uniref:acetyl-CoA hydrolase/transferase family protein n=1 Tax=Myroides phaeus TaxID=702745 RepID=UPI002DB5F4E9|nr:acetyl-CoA hydrolase/transferase C-terminal domain-containing protein [Myroides phaeus]MEC4115913.1 acetyl-CoA hydrolase/transferase C-terminal domain-containing protein [Myroides phaeus]